MARHNFSVLSIIPIFFYDLSEKKHADYIRALRVRAAVNNYENNELDENDINFVKEAVEYASGSDDKFMKKNSANIIAWKNYRRKDI